MRGRKLQNRQPKREKGFGDSSHRLLLMKLRKALAQAGDPTKAIAMQAYMKSEMPFHGVSSPLLKKICREVFAEVDLSTFELWESKVRYLWREAKFREERYSALHLAGHFRAKSYQTTQSIHLYEELIVSGAWWDFVDTIATQRVAVILHREPKPTQRLMLKWSKSSNLWKRRTAILCQNSAKDQIDLGFLYSCIKPSLGSHEFFLRKAIGWALRQVAWRNPKEVIRYVKANRKKLSPLSKREALKNLIRSGTISAIP
jgi:3-methyladenine DNA glycosylase AlkD